MVNMGGLRKATLALAATMLVSAIIGTAFASTSACKLTQLHGWFKDTHGNWVFVQCAFGCPKGVVCDDAAACKAITNPVTGAAVDCACFEPDGSVILIGGCKSMHADVNTETLGCDGPCGPGQLCVAGDWVHVQDDATHSHDTRTCDCVTE